MSQRTKLICLQAAVVAALATVVYMTLLAPEGSDPLEGVETPNGSLAGPDGSRAGDGQRGDGRGPNAGDGASGTLVASSGPTPLGVVLGATVPGGEPFGASAPPTREPGGPPGDRPAHWTPGDDQYDDAVSSLMGKLDR